MFSVSHQNQYGAPALCISHHCGWCVTVSPPFDCFLKSQTHSVSVPEDMQLYTENKSDFPKKKYLLQAAGIK